MRIVEKSQLMSAAEIDRTEQYPWDNVDLLREAGYFGMTIPAAYRNPGGGMPGCPDSF